MMNVKLATWQVCPSLSTVGDGNKQALETR